VEFLSITIYLAAVGAVKGPASGLESEPQVNPVGDTVEEMDEGPTAHSEEKEKCNFEDSAPPILTSIAGDEAPQETEGRATPVSDGLQKHSEKDMVALDAIERVGWSPKDPAGVIEMPSGK
jgi:hypothetical protein